MNPSLQNEILQIKAPADNDITDNLHGHDRRTAMLNYYLWSLSHEGHNASIGQRAFKPIAVLS